jgi:Ca2+-transporting ATPase
MQPSDPKVNTPAAQDLRTPWHTLGVQAVLSILEVDSEAGLSHQDAQDRRGRFGPNELISRGLRNPWKILLEQFMDAMVIVLLVAAVISILLQDPKDAIVILAIVILNAGLGFTQEYRAERAMEALKRMAEPVVKVRRGGEIRTIDSRDLVPGDVIRLEAGDAVPADARLIEAANLRSQESALTGESLPVDKTTAPINEESIPLGDRHNMLYMGTVVTYGRGTAVVTETGMDTQLGEIASMIQTVETEPTPLQRRMGRLGRSLALAALAIVVLVFLLGALQGEDLTEMFFTAVALSVAAVPEGLPAVVTISLALGAQRMLRRQALIRKLPAVETLGSVTVICSDKTGTLTENRMQVRILDVAEHTIDLEQTLRKGMPTLRASEVPAESKEAALSLLLMGGALCNDAILQADQEHHGDFTTVGDPTEGALLIAAAQHDLWKSELEASLPRAAEIPFTSERKRMTTVHEVKEGELAQALRENLSPALGEDPSAFIAFTKGAVDGLLSISSRVLVTGRLEEKDEEWTERIQTANDEMAKDGLRVLGLACRSIQQIPEGDLESELERDLIFIGMVGMMDPPRPEVQAAVETCKTAGIRPVMITGDHPLTAQRIARDLGISQNGRVLTGSELSRISSTELDGLVEQVAVYARVSPADKLDIVGALQGRGHIAAMTGDGVNDAPALRRSDIGVAMGITGTDVAKEASDMVILDDNFATIVRAVEEGRTIYDNVRKFIKYTLTSNTGEIVTMLLAPLLGMPIPLTALQILWINLVTDGLPGLALGLEPAEANTMRRPPYPPEEGVFARGLGGQILRIGVLMGVVSLGVGFWGWRAGLASWQSMVFTTLTLSQMGNALAVRSSRDSLFTIGLRSNLPMLGAVALTFLLQIALLYIAPLRGLFELTPLTTAEFAISMLAATVPFLAFELEKLLRRRGSGLKPN